MAVVGRDSYRTAYPDADVLVGRLARPLRWGLLVTRPVERDFKPGLLPLLLGGTWKGTAGRCKGAAFVYLIYSSYVSSL